MKKWYMHISILFIVHAWTSFTYSLELDTHILDYHNNDAAIDFSALDPYLLDPDLYIPDHNFDLDLLNPHSEQNATCNQNVLPDSDLITLPTFHEDDEDDSEKDCKSNPTPKRKKTIDPSIKYQCDIGLCKKIYCHKKDLIRHQQTAHGNIKPFKCEICKQSFFRKDVLAVHEQTHKTEKQFECPRCEKTFLTSSDCKRHQVTHTKKKPFECAKCGTSFNNSSNRNRHMKKCEQ